MSVAVAPTGSAGGEALPLARPLLLDLCGEGEYPTLRHVLLDLGIKQFQGLYRIRGLVGIGRPEWARR